MYISAATNLSQMWAMYCLVRFYALCATELKAVRPVGKLIAVKSVVFFTYSQSCAIAALHWLELLPSSVEETGEHWSTEDVGRGLQDWLICIGTLCSHPKERGSPHQFSRIRQRCCQRRQPLLRPFV